MKTKRKKPKVYKAWCCVGSHGNLYVTETTPHAQCIGRFEIYETKDDALRNDAPERVKECTIRVKL